MNEEIDFDDLRRELGISEDGFDELLTNVFNTNNDDEQQSMNDNSNQLYTLQNLESDQLLKTQPSWQQNQNQTAELTYELCMSINPALIHTSIEEAQIVDVINLPPIQLELNNFCKQHENQKATSSVSKNSQQQDKDIKIIFTEMPQSTIRFRSVTDPNTHGVIKGATSTSSSSHCFPTIRLDIADDEQKYCNYYVLVDCYIKIDNKENENEPILSPHLFGHKRARTYRNNESKRPKYDVINEPILEEIQSVNGFLEYSFKNYFIISQSRDAISAIRAKYENLQTRNLIGQVDFDYIEAKKDIIMKSNNSVCLGFTIYEKTSNGFRHCCGPKLSTPIYHANKTIQLIRICNERGKVSGGGEITLLVTGLTEKKIAVVIKETSGDWSTEIANDKLKIHQKAAITFDLPAYGGQSQHYDGDINCDIFLKRPEDGIQSESVRFIYERLEEPRRKSPRSNQSTAEAATQAENSIKGLEYFTDSVCLKPPLKKYNNISEECTKNDDKSQAVEYNIKKFIGLLENKEAKNKEKLFSEEFVYEDDFGNTIFHDAIEYDKFLKIYPIIKNFGLKELLRELRNDYGDTILHHACRLRKSNYVRSLIGMELKLFTQNIEKQTPLHLAIESCDKATIQIWTELIDNPKEYPHFVAEFKRNLSAYNKEGYTVLHSAIIKDQRELVKAILRFYQNNDIDLNEYEVLGNGDSVLHLAATQRLKEMTKLIIQMEEEALYYENYRGEVAIDCVKLLNNLNLE